MAAVNTNQRALQKKIDTAVANVIKLKRRRVRIAASVKNLKAAVAGECDVTTDMIEEAVVLLRFYAARLAKLRDKNQDFVDANAVSVDD